MVCISNFVEYTFQFFISKYEKDNFSENVNLLKLISKL